MASDTASWFASDRHVTAERPWPGLLSFSEADREFFFGRDAESEELLSLVINYRLTTLYGLSGLGKTSLLHAGLFPRLRERDFLPIRLRFDLQLGAPSPSTQIKNALVGELAAHQIEAPLPAGEESVWEYLHRPQTEFWSGRHRLLTPVLVFDQFEEIFSRIPRDAWGQELRALVIATVGDLAQGRAPASIKAALDRTPTIAANLQFVDHRYRVLLAIREDYLADLDDLALEMPSISLSRMRLSHMRGSTATQAVLAAGSVGGIIAPDVAFKIVEFVGESMGVRGSLSLPHVPIEPALLSVVCRELNEERIRRGLAQITVEQLHSSEAILMRFYDEAIRDSPPALRRFLEDRLVTTDGVREMVAYQTLAAVRGATDADIERLIEKRILRIEYREGRRLVELTHDRLGPVLRDSRIQRERRQAQDDASTTQPIDNRGGHGHELAADMRQLAALLEGLRALGSTRVLDEVLALVIDAAIEITGCERGVILMTGSNQMLEPKLARAKGRVTLAPPVAFGESVVEKVFETGMSAIIDDVSTPAHAGTYAGELALGIRSIVCLPLRLVRYLDRVELPNPVEPIGVLYLDSRERGTPLSSQSRVGLETLSTEASVAIENARLYRETLEKSRIDQELRIAAEIQRALLPRNTVVTSWCQAAAMSIPSRSIGGDFFNYVELPNGPFCFVIGDVAGKGAPAALLSATVQGMFAIYAATVDSPAETVKQVNKALMRLNIESRFLTAFYGMLWPDGRLLYCNAGHVAPLFLSNDTVSRLESVGMIIGLLEEAHFEDGEQRLAVGDTVVVVSDGVTEALSATGEEFGDDRVSAYLASASGANVSDLRDGLVERLQTFSANAPQSDDVTAMVIRYTGTSR